MISGEGGLGMLECDEKSNSKSQSGPGIKNPRDREKVGVPSVPLATALLGGGVEYKMSEDPYTFQYGTVDICIFDVWYWVFDSRLGILGIRYLTLDFPNVLDIIPRPP